MVKHECQRCGKEFKQRSNLIDHLSRQNPCIPSKSNIDANILLEEMNGKRRKAFTCNECDKSFAAKIALDYHTKHKVCHKPCHIVTTVNSDNKVIINVNNFINNATVTNTLINPYHNTTHMFDARFFDYHGKNDFGKECLDYITPEMIRDYLDELCDISSIMKTIYFNPQYPENNTIALYNIKKDQYVTVRDGRLLLQDLTFVSYTIKNTLDKLMSGYCNDSKELLENIIQHEKITKDAAPEMYYDLQVFEKELESLNTRMDWLKQNIIALKKGRIDTAISTQIESHSRPIGTPALLPKDSLYLPHGSIHASESNFWSPEDLLLLTMQPQNISNASYCETTKTFKTSKTSKTSNTSNTTKTSKTSKTYKKSKTSNVPSVNKDDIGAALKRMFGENAPDLGENRFMYEWD